MNTTAPLLDNLVRQVYELILHTANRFLTHSEKFPIEFLAKENPSYKDIANLIDGARVNIREAMDAFDPMLAQQAEEYCQLMIRMAAAIIEENKGKLADLCDELRRKPFAMP
jgi:hypothetical protein